MNNLIDTINDNALLNLLKNQLDNFTRRLIIHLSNLNLK